MKREIQEEIYKSLEGRLNHVLQPVAPTPQFIDHLRGKISIAPPQVVVNRLNDTQYLLFVLGGALSVLLLLITGTRALYYLFVRK